MRKLSIFNKAIFFLNIIFALVTIISLVIPFVPVTSMPTLSAISIVVPFLVLINVAFVLYWILGRKKRFLALSGILLLLWYIFLGPFYEFSSKEGGQPKDARSLSIMSFNARSFNEMKQLKVDNVDSLIYNFVSTQDPDIVCFQETLYAMKRNNALSQYKYKFVDFIYGKRRGKVILSVYSKFPIIKVESIDFPKSANNAIYADVLFAGDTIRVYNIHLQSFRITPELSIKQEESSKLFARVKKVMLKQYEQANLIRENIVGIPYKKIVVGDFNNTQYSNVYRTIKGEMEDSYLDKGTAFGRTYDLLGFPLRIDYIMADSEFEVLSHQNFNEKLSDHYPIMATLRLP